jgi:hypothetical protein
MIGRRSGASGGRTACRECWHLSEIRPGANVGKPSTEGCWHMRSQSTYIHTYTHDRAEVSWTMDLPRIESHESPSACAR